MLKKPVQCFANCGNKNEHINIWVMKVLHMPVVYVLRPKFSFNLSTFSFKPFIYYYFSSEAKEIGNYKELLFDLSFPNI